MVMQESPWSEKRRGHEDQILGILTLRGAWKKKSLQKSLRSYSQRQRRKTRAGVSKAKDKIVRNTSERVNKFVSDRACYYLPVPVLLLFYNNEFWAAPNKNYISQPPL